ncbi:response regulator transcription factor [Paenibacillus harenae]|uniref:NarL family two-component system response regulator LiaR n=1 Tax=Paenibacillus harenae TaxID=306543 RepID=A0ABT9TVC6_PAEHA|nr:response regulator transcription factor [Paenibacillus harenae]MDQ0057966.1 NarL family two-component system response regulator LiaR [Paenibacillus harenae]MDQ0111313.1 NarL family two-component system response regulator LiaR [Paenibacillus harenae]
MNHIKVFVVEDDPDWIKAITSYLNREEDILVVGAATNADEAIRGAQTTQIDILLMDIQLAGSKLDGIQTAMELHGLTSAKIIMLTSLNDEQSMTKAFTAGAIHYLEKTQFKELPQAIRNAHLYPAPMEALLKEFARLKREEQLKDLTPAEREVYELIEAGHTQSQIEQKLFKAESTLKNQVNKMLKKFGVKSSKEAIEKVKKRGLFDRSEGGND